MDTRLKNYEQLNTNSKAGIAYILSYIMASVGATVSCIMISITAAMVRIKNSIDAYPWYDEEGVDNTEAWIYYEGRWTGTLSDDFTEKLSLYGKWAIVWAVAAAAAMIVIFVLSGRFTNKASAAGGLNWFDRIWTEVQLLGAILSITGICGLVALIYSLWPCGEEMLDVFKSAYPQEDYYGVPNDLAMFGLMAALAALVVITVFLMASMVKKLKYRQFLRASLIGGILIFIWRDIFGGIAGGIKGSNRTTVKVVIYMLILAGVEGFCGYMMWAHWNGALWLFGGIIFAVVWILLFVPKKIRKINEIKKGAAEIRKGNLSYKIPVVPGIRGSLDEFDRLAQNINHIGEAQHIAVQNELKNQRLKTELISNVSHDLKTPLTSMVSYIDLLKKEGLDSPNAEEYLNILDSKTQRLKNLTENLFEAAKASSGAIPVNIEDIDFYTLIMQSLAELDDKLSKNDLTVLVNNKCENGLKVKADGQLLCRVVENLLSNVSKYALAGSRVYVDLFDHNGKVFMEMKNISAQQLNISEDELMERFKRGDESRNTEGSGLGLAIAKDLMKLMEGHFEITIDGDLFKAQVVLNEA